ncbi:hypothetical protein CCACVL1_23045, partial [Corchorus capsularis]
MEAQEVVELRKSSMISMPSTSNVAAQFVQQEE